MAVQYLNGFEAQAILADSLPGTSGALGGTAAYDTTIKRTGGASLRCNPASGASGKVTLGGAGTLNFLHFGLYIATLPSITRNMSGNNPAGIRLNSNGTLAYYNASGVLVGTSTVALQTGVWYWIGLRQTVGTSVDAIQVDGVTVLNCTTVTMSITTQIGFGDTEASAVDAYFDDIIADDTGFIQPSKVALLVPTADSAVGTGWTLGTGTAISGNSGSTAVKNKPPLGVADLAVGSDPKQIRNASANANTNYDATMTTYAAAGIAAADAILAIRPIVATAAPVVTSAKQGTVGVVSNPAIANVALGAAGTAGAFWQGAAGGAYPTGWKHSSGTLTLSPSVTVGTAPVMRVTQVTSSTQIAVVCFMGMYVAWTPAPKVAYNSQPMTQILAQ